MTHTLHPEIEKLLTTVSAIIALGKKNDPLRAEEARIKSEIKYHLGPYLHMPTDLKDNEPLPEKKRKYKYINKQTGSPFVSDTPLDLSDARELEEEQKQSTPKIEKIEVFGTDNEFEAMATNKINEIIDYINKHILDTNKQL